MSAAVSVSPLDANAIKDVLSVIVNPSGRLEDATLDYLSGMLEDEVAAASGGIASIDGAALQNLLGAFIVDAGVCANEAELVEMCNVLAQSLVAKAPAASINCGSAGTFSRDENAEPSVSEVEPNIDFCARSLLLETAPGFHDPYLGLQKVNVNFNSSISLSEALELESVAQKERRRQQDQLRAWERNKLPLPKPCRRHGSKQLKKPTDIIVHSFSVSAGGRDLLCDASLKIVLGRKYGLIGRNGIGKSTFIGALVRHEIPGLNDKDLSIGCVEQEISQEDLGMRAIDAVLAVDVERTTLLSEVAQLTAEQNLTEEQTSRLVAAYARMDEIEAASAENTAAAILAGLGFTQAMQEQRISELSGGWRVRVALSRALFAMPDILCLDEPTNHLDLHAVAWLTGFLQSFRGTCLIVSHARGFLNDVCSDIVEFREQQLKYYRGDYDTFERVKTEEERVNQRRQEAQQIQRDHVQKFINRFRYNAARAALVQSRIKALEKLPMLHSASNDPTLTFNFGEPDQLSLPILQLDEAWFSYKAESEPKTAKNMTDSDPSWVLKAVNLNVGLDSRIAICGVNGSGKSTLLHMLCGSHEPARGSCRRNMKLRVGFFSQYHVDQLDLTLNSVQQLQAKYPEHDLKDEAARAFLGRFGISGLLALEPLYILSGGQKSRVAIALMAFSNPHILALDEPTNHLDLDAIQALISALNAFEGGIVIVSHDVHMLSCVVDTILHVDSKTHTVRQYPGDVESYKRDLLLRKI